MASVAFVKVRKDLLDLRVLLLKPDTNVYTDNLVEYFVQIYCLSS